MRRFIPALILGLLILLGPITLSSASVSQLSHLELVRPVRNKDAEFENALFHIKFNVSRGFGFTIENRSPKTIEIDWNKSAFIDTASRAQRVFHLGVRYVDRNSAMPPTVVPTGSSVSEIAVPTDWISFEKSEWRTKVVFEAMPDFATGATAGLQLNLRIGDQIRDFKFLFRWVAGADKTVITSASAEQLEITENSFGSDWPFSKVSTGKLLCGGNRAVIFIAAGNPYALNEAAMRKLLDGKEVSSDLTKLVGTITDVKALEAKLKKIVDVGLALCK